MYRGINITPPLFEIGLKGYAYGKKALELAKAADRISRVYDVKIIFDPQYVDIPVIARETENILIFAQHMDALPIGRGTGGVLAEALKDAGASGTLLNHSEKKLELQQLRETIQRADAAGLATMVCADSPEEAVRIAKMGPNIIIAEPPELIGTGRSVGREKKDFILKTLKGIKKINPEIIVLFGAGVKTAEDVAEIVRLGAEATGSTSGILEAEDPVQKIEELVGALRKAWISIHNSGTRFYKCQF